MPPIKNIDCRLTVKPTLIAGACTLCKTTVPETFRFHLFFLLLISVLCISFLECLPVIVFTAVVSRDDL